MKVGQEEEDGRLAELDNLAFEVLKGYIKPNVGKSLWSSPNQVNE